MILHLLIVLLVIQVAVIGWLIKLTLITCGKKRDLIRYLKTLIGKEITVQTNAGSVSGTLTKVVKNGIELLETSGDIILVPLNKINSIKE